MTRNEIVLILVIMELDLYLKDLCARLPYGVS